jgi:hypothetical protein
MVLVLMENRATEDEVGVVSWATAGSHEENTIWSWIISAVECCASVQDWIKKPSLARLSGAAQRHQIQHLIDGRTHVGGVGVVGVRLLLGPASR